MKFRILFLMAAVALFSCKTKEYDVTSNGLQYKIYNEGKGPKAKVGDVVKIHMVNKTEKDSILSSTYKIGKPITLKVEKPAFKGDPMEGFTMLSEGDSATFLVSVDSLAQGNPLPPFLKKGDFLKFDVKMVKIMSEADYKKEVDEKRAEEMKMEQESLGKDTVTIKEFLDANKIKAQKTPSGVYYVVQKKGSGPMPTPGQNVTVHYTGKLLNGPEFDSDRGQGFTFPLGQGQVIPGWDDAISLLNKGTKATLYIPSALGYGMRGAGNSIPPGSILVFDVEILDIK